MEIIEITATYSRKVQIEQYEPMEIAEEITAVLDEDDDPDEVYDELYATARDSVERKLTHRLAAKKMEDQEDQDE